MLARTRTLLAASLALSLTLIGCGTEDPDPGTTPDLADPDAPDPDAQDGDPDADEPANGEPDDGAVAGFPATVVDGRGIEVTIDERPGRIVSLSATHTEILYALDAGDQVVAVDEQSDFPAEAPTTDLSGFEPNVEAIAEEEPDLVIIAFDPGGLAASLEQLDVDVLLLPTAVSVDDAYAQWEIVGSAVGRVDQADQLVQTVESRLQELALDLQDLDGTLTYFHELDENLYTATSATFVGDIYGRFPLENIADPADDGSGFPQVSEEFVVEADPDLVFLADSAYGQTPEVVAERPGWETMTAVQEGNLIEVDPDLSSRWGPRLVEFAQLVVDAVRDAA